MWLNRPGPVILIMNKLLIPVPVLAGYMSTLATAGQGSQILDPWTAAEPAATAAAAVAGDTGHHSKVIILYLKKGKPVYLLVANSIYKSK